MSYNVKEKPPDAIEVSQHRKCCRPKDTPVVAKPETREIGTSLQLSLLLRSKNRLKS